MTKIYTGPIKRMYVSDLEVNGNNINRIFSDIVVLKDQLFYQNFVNNKISFNYDTKLPDRQEALGYMKDYGFNDILFVDYNELEYAYDLPKKKVRALKKEFKKKNK